MDKLLSMADASQLSKRERQIMDVIYAHGSADISQIMAGIPDPPMRGAVRTLLRILEQKGVVARHNEGRTVIFRPVQSRSRMGRSAFQRVLGVFFNGSIEKALASYLSDAGKSAPTSEELDRLSRLIDEARRKGG